MGTALTLEGMNFRIRIRIVETEEDWEKALEVRWRGYGKYFSGGCKYDLMDAYDFQPNCTILLAEDEDNNLLATGRFLDRRYGKIELEEFIDVDNVLPESGAPVVEGTRFSIPRHPFSPLIKFASWKVFYTYCKANNVDTGLVSVRAKGGRDYQRLQWDHAGEAGIYYHRLLGGKEHHTYLWNLPTAPKR